MKIFVLLSGAIFLGLVQCAKLDGSEPVACTTPDGKPGYCVNIRSCRQISNLLRPPTSEKTKEFVRNSACKGPHKYSVCCRSAPASEDDDIFDSRTREGNLYCEPYMTAHPPDPSTGCCGTSATLGNKIVGSDGEGTGIDQYPWTVLIEYESGMGLEICGGVLISGRYALTAAHCVTGAILRRAIPKFVRLGEYNITNQGPDCKLSEGGGQDCTDGVTRVPIEKIIPHPNYSFSANDKRNDIALIKLKELAPYSDFIRPICLPTKDINLSSNRNDYFTMIVVGWGATEKTNYSDVKLEVKVPYVPLEQCRAYYDKFKLFQLGKGQLCAGGQNGLNNCKGDSGGPLMFKNGNLFELAGIVSFGKTDCKQGVPGVYTDIYAYKDWIMSILLIPEPQTT